MHAPDFWWRPQASLAATLLRPVGAVYGAVTAARMARPGVALPVPVVCVGNLVAGGAGKTPAALALGRLLLAAGHRPAFLSRGYGRSRSGSEVIHVDGKRDDARRGGDEPLLLARLAPTYVATDRLKGATRALEGGADVLVLDDGLQNPRLAKSFSLAVADGGSGSGNGLPIPAGPLRAPASRQWPFVSALCVIGEGAPGQRLADEAHGAGVPVVTARLVPRPEALASLAGRPLLAFAGIGRPQKFWDTLAAAGLEVVGRRAFADHHSFTTQNRDTLLAEARRLGADLVTTEKDLVRLPPGFPAEALPVDLVFDDPAIMRERLAEL